MSGIFKPDDVANLLHLQAEGENSAMNKGRIRKSNENLILAAAERAFSQYGFKGTTMAQIAEEAGLPKANLHYYFSSKKNLYLHLLNRILTQWLDPMSEIYLEADPKIALEAYVRQKMRLVFDRPQASKLFANELLQGAKVLNGLLHTTLKQLVAQKSAVIEQWISEGKIKPIDSVQLFFSMWAMTQTYADFDVQINAVLGQSIHHHDQQERAIEHVLTMVFRSCGLDD
ncbi:TetR family transcriptional regulator C-terminal domain-containing protein [Celerinatantimonas diazotrophica]|uniref:TetR family transcriptional regulator n=1 Tax=Celerinatantimonas diazotrophica TaxID=412034 RepID=A0A4R1K182_9GAMM|nr:TetR family transcriptional regulator C-terminal domain-containing protein [Celerinatantimonas diazotrophica]TCK57738.1 TetR family transcriptional regulator [Celerinatantimonas diazotrophica]CAG9298200.1 HTH-type transcriptional regulator RutR [Celerinatantimonas diazotrophica]